MKYIYSLVLWDHLSHVIVSSCAYSATFPNIESMWCLLFRCTVSLRAYFSAALSLSVVCINPATLPLSARHPSSCLYDVCEVSSQTNRDREREGGVSLQINIALSWDCIWVIPLQKSAPIPVSMNTKQDYRHNPFLVLIFKDFLLYFCMGGVLKS